MLQAGVLSELRGSLLVGAQYLMDCHVAPGQFVAQVRGFNPGPGTAGWVQWVCGWWMGWVLLPPMLSSCCWHGVESLSWSCVVADWRPSRLRCQPCISQWLMDGPSWHAA